MSRLHALQTAFLAGIRATDETRALKAGVTGRFEIYRNAYRMRLLEALVDAFEKTARYLGGDFESAALDYIAQTPPQARNLRWYGETLPQWLAKRFPDDADVPELAELDWLLRRAFDAQDVASIKIDALAAVADFTQLKLVFTPSFALMSVTTNVAAIWQAIDADRIPPAAAALDFGAGIVIWRVKHQPHFRSVDANEFGCLTRLAGRCSLAETLEAISADTDTRDSAQQFAIYLRRWFDDGLIAALS